MPPKKTKKMLKASMSSSKTATKSKKAANISSSLNIPIRLGTDGVGTSAHWVIISSVAPTVFPYSISTLTWDTCFLTNKEHVYCYCGRAKLLKNGVLASTYDENVIGVGSNAVAIHIQCSLCHQWFHQPCVPSIDVEILAGDRHYYFRCGICEGGNEVWARMHMGWNNATALALFNLHLEHPEQEFFLWQEDICSYIDLHWASLLPCNARSSSWKFSVANALSVGCDFVSGQKVKKVAGWWALKKTDTSLGCPSQDSFKKLLRRLMIGHGAEGAAKKRIADSAGHAAYDSGRRLIRLQRTLISRKEADRKRRQLGIDSQLNNEEREVKVRKLDHADRDNLNGHELTPDHELDMEVLENGASSLLFRDYDFNNQRKTDESFMGSRPVSSAMSDGGSSSSDMVELYSENEDIDLGGLGHRNLSHEDNEQLYVPPLPLSLVNAVTPIVPSVPPVPSPVFTCKSENVPKEEVPPSSRNELSTDGSPKPCVVNDDAPSNIVQALSNSSAVLKCPSCHEPRAPGAKFCAMCGTRLSTALGVSTSSRCLLVMSEAEKRMLLFQVNGIHLPPPWACAKTEDREVIGAIARLKRKLLVQARLQKNSVVNAASSIGELDTYVRFALQKASGGYDVDGVPFSSLHPTPAVLDYIDIPLRDSDDSINSSSSWRRRRKSKKRELNTSSNDGVDPEKLILVTASDRSALDACLGGPDGDDILQDAKEISGLMTELFTSPYSGRSLKPFIRRDFETALPSMLRDMHVADSISVGVTSEVGASYPIDYCYLRPWHVRDVNKLLTSVFWPGINVASALRSPDFTIVALYHNVVIGTAIMTPAGYITFIAVNPRLEGIGIGTFMLFHLLQTRPSIDITLHVSANNNAMILYQKFGFKAEQFVVDFYDKYLPPDSAMQKNAFFLRLRQ